MNFTHQHGWYFYALDTIDCGWWFLKTMEESKSEFYKAMDDSNLKPGTGTGFIDKFERDWEIVGTLSFWWDHEWDFRGRTRVLWLPNPKEGNFVYAFVWRHDSDGTCFVASPIELPWLKEH